MYPFKIWTQIVQCLTTYYLLNKKCNKTLYRFARKTFSVGKEWTVQLIELRPIKDGPLEVIDVQNCVTYYDQMARLSIQYLALFNKDNFPNSTKNVKEGSSNK